MEFSHLQVQRITDPRVHTVLALIEANIEHPMSLDDLAKAVNLSTWRLCHLFRIQTGCAPLRYSKIIRMDQARKLLETTFLSVKEVMSKVGATDESHFVRDFKTHHGLYPSELRQQFFQRAAESNL